MRASLLLALLALDGGSAAPARDDSDAFFADLELLRHYSEVEDYELLRILVEDGPSGSPIPPRRTPSGRPTRREPRPSPR